MKITNKLKEYRKKQDLSQAKLAKIVGISETHYQRIEYGTSKPNVEIAILIAQALQTTVEELFPLSQRNSSDSTNLTNKE